jgi:3'-phosphoadenosine 5'-phosphosulfate sulfotransferase (PAPS reductase)/FAD synthetase
MAFWTEQDVLLYVKRHGIEIASVYGNIVNDTDNPDEVEGQMRFDDLDPEKFGLFDLERPVLKTTGCSRTGCMFCAFGCQQEKGEGRFERLKRTHPKQYEYIMKPWDEGGLGYKEVIDWINENGGFYIKY